MAPAQRIVYTVEMLMGETRISVSVVTVEFRPKGGGTHLIFTEQVASSTATRILPGAGRAPADFWTP